MGVSFYHNMWKARCVELHKCAYQVVILREQIKRMKEGEDTDSTIGLHGHLQKHTTDEENATCKYMRSWMQGH